MSKYATESSARVALDLTERVRVLHVDDDQCLLCVTKQCLETEGAIQVDSVLSADEALAKLEKEKYDILISDYQMPGKDGLELLKELRQKGETIPFIMFTGKGREEVVIQALNLGANQYVNKMGEAQTVYTELAHSIKELARPKRAEEDARKAVSLLSATLESTADGILVVDEYNRISSFNRRFVEMWQIPKDVTLSKTDPDHVNLKRTSGQALDFLKERLKNPDEFVKNTRELYTDKCEAETDGSLEFRDGRIFEYYSRPQRVGSSVVGRVWSFRDITERRKAEESLNQSERNYRELFENATDTLLTLDLNGSIRTVNNAVLKWGFKKEDILGRNLLEFVSENCRSIIVRESLETFHGRPVRNEAEIETPKGKISVEYSASPMEKEGRIVGAQISLRDITERKKTEKTLNRLAIAVDCTVDGIAVADINGIIQFVNPAWAKMHGYTKSELLGKHLSVFHTEDQMKKDVIPFNEKVLKNGSNQGEVGHVKKNGTIFQTLMTTTLLRDEDGSPSGFVGTAKDATESQKAKEALKESEERFRNLFEKANDGLVFIDFDGRIIDINEKATELAGLKKEDMVGMPFLELNLLAQQNMPQPSNGSGAFSSHSTEGIEVSIKRKNGGLRQLEVNTSVIEQNGIPKGALAIVRDITERRRAERSSCESEEKLKAILASSPDAITVFDLNGNIVDLNDAAMNLHGFSSKEEIVGKSSFDFITAKDRKRAVEAFQSMQKKGQVQNLEFTLQDKRGKEFPVLLSANVILDSQGKPTAVAATTRDITELKAAEGKLRESEEKYRNMIELAPYIVVSTDLKGVITSFNSVGERLSGYSKSEVIGKHFSRIGHIALRDVPRYIRAFNAVVRGEAVGPFRVTMCREDGTRRRVEIQVALLKKDGKTTGVQAFVTDITEREETQAAVQQSQKKFEALFMGNPEAAACLGPDFRIVDINPRFEELFGYSVMDISGKHINEVVVPKDRVTEAQKLDEKALEGYVYFNTFRRRKDGLLISVSVSAAPIMASRKLLGYVVVYKDISDLKEKEEELAMMNEKLRVVGSLTRHDVRNKLTAITGNTYLIRKKMENNNTIDENLKSIDSASKQIVEIFEFARDYEKLKAERLVYLNVRKLFEEAISLFPDMNGARAVVNCEGLMVRGDSLLRQAFYNLIDDSLRYARKLSRIKLTYKKNADESIDLIYQDDGVGISAEARPKLFQEGFTTGNGTGYGLYLVKKIVEAYGWTIEETGEAEEGARFNINIPKKGRNLDENYQLVTDRSIERARETSPLQGSIQDSAHSVLSDSQKKTNYESGDNKLGR